LEFSISSANVSVDAVAARKKQQMQEMNCNLIVESVNNTAMIRMVSKYYESPNNNNFMMIDQK
jgi:hypothetical protein